MVHPCEKRNETNCSKRWQPGTGQAPTAMLAVIASECGKYHKQDDHVKKNFAGDSDRECTKGIVGGAGSQNLL
jgi:hypothetical protein